MKNENYRIRINNYKNGNIHIKCIVDKKFIIWINILIKKHRMKNL
jgi:hypothetical protein